MKSQRWTERVDDESLFPPEGEADEKVRSRQQQQKRRIQLTRERSKCASASGLYDDEEDSVAPLWRAAESRSFKTARIGSSRWTPPPPDESCIDL